MSATFTRSAAAFRTVRHLVAAGGMPWQRLAASTGLGVLGGAATVGLLAGSGAVVARAAFRPGLGAIAGLLATVEVIAFLRGPLRYGERLLGHDAAFRVLARWRVWLYDRLEPLSPAGLRAWRSGDLLARAIDDVDQLQDLYLRSAPPVIIAITTSVLAVVVVGVLVPYAAVLLGLSLAAALTVPPAVALAVHRSEQRQSELQGQMAADIVDLLRGAAELLVYGRAEELLARVEAADSSITRSAKRRALATGLSSALVTALLGVAVIGVLILSANAVHHHDLDPVMMAILPLAAIGAFESVSPMVAVALHIDDALNAGRRLLALQEVPVPVIDPAHAEPLPSGAKRAALRDASLRYAQDLPRALNGIDLQLEPGDRTALIGRSGSGKTSIINTFLRFWPLEEGEFTLGGASVDQLRQYDVRQSFGLLDQDADLFSDSIRDNVAIANPRADEADIDDALRLAQLQDWIGTLPEGLDTPVGEHGAKVSGGQRQRIAMARVLLRGAPVLLLDEPTSGLEPEVAANLLSDVRRAFGETAILLVTHRRQDLEGFHVLRVERGRIVADRKQGPDRTDQDGSR